MGVRYNSPELVQGWVEEHRILSRRVYKSVPGGGGGGGGGG